MNIPIVNKNDEIISYKDRSEIDYENDIFRAASLWIVNKNGDILLAQRKFNKKVNPGKWAEAVGGTVEGNDSYYDTVVREAQEELGIENIEIVESVKQFITIPCQYFTQWYTAEINEPIEFFTIQEEEVEQIAWFLKDQLANELKTNPDKFIEILPEVIKLLS